MHSFRQKSFTVEGKKGKSDGKTQYGKRDDGCKNDVWLQKNLKLQCVTTTTTNSGEQSRAQHARISHSVKT